MGEFDVYLLAKQYGAQDLQELLPALARRLLFCGAGENGPKDQIAMMYFSRWDSPEAARDFAKLYADYLPKRYQKAVRSNRRLPSRPGLLTCMCSTPTRGKPFYEVEGNDLLIMEGYDDSVVQKARAIYFYGMSLPAFSSEGEKLNQAKFATLHF